MEQSCTVLSASDLKLYKNSFGGSVVELCSTRECSALTKIALRFYGAAYHRETHHPERKNRPSLTACCSLSFRS